MDYTLEEIAERLDDGVAALQSIAELLAHPVQSAPVFDFGAAVDGSYTSRSEIGDAARVFVSRLGAANIDRLLKDFDRLDSLGRYGSDALLEIRAAAEQVAH